MSQYIESLKFCTNNIDVDNFNFNKFTRVKIKEYFVDYFLLMRDTIFENDKIQFYCIASTISNETGYFDSDIVMDVTTDEDFAVEIFLSICKNVVTPVTLKDCVYDIIFDKYGQVIV
ncbi:MAG: DUF6514 family protein [Oscillospiraceae bacterium]